MKVRFYHDILPILNFSKYLFYMRRRSVQCGTKNIQFVKNDLSHKISKKNVLFLKRNNGMVVHSRHSAVYAHILYGGGQYIGNGIVVSWILQSTVHYIPVSVPAISWPDSSQYTWPVAWQKAQPRGTISFLAYFLLPQSPKPIVQFFFPRSTVIH